MSDFDPRLAEYAMGTLAPPEREDVERELEASAEARAMLVEIESALSELEPELPELEPSASLRDAVLAQAGNPQPGQGLAPRLARFLDLAPERVAELMHLLRDPHGSAWEASPVPGTRVAHFAGGPRVGEADCGFVRLEPGESFPAHRHQGDEWALVLSGRGIDSSGARWAPGDLVHQPEGSEHHFRVTGDEPLVFALVLFEGLELV